MRYTDKLTSFFKHRAKWYRDGDLLLYVPTVDGEREEFTHPTVYRLRDGLISESTDAERLRHDGNVWILDNARTFSVETAQVKKAERLEVDLRVSPRDLIDVTGDPRTMRTPTIARLIERRRHAGVDITGHRLALQHRFSFAFFGWCMACVAIPWAIHPDRRRSLAVTLGIGVVFVAVSLAGMQVFRLAALGHKIPVWLGAWGPSLVCLLLLVPGEALYQRYRSHGGFF